MATKVPVEKASLPTSEQDTRSSFSSPEADAASQDNISVNMDNGANEKGRSLHQSKHGLWSRIYDILSYTPERCRYNPEKPFQFSMGLNILFGE